MTLIQAAAAVHSADGTKIASYRAGTGPSIVLIDPALSTHTGAAKLTSALLADFTVISYDRRGRGGSGDEHADQPTTDREIDDIAALLELSGDPAVLFGSSSGAALALAAASRLGDRVRAVVAFEPPFICDDSRPPLAADLSARIAASLRAGDRAAAVRTFFIEALGVPRAAVGVMRLTPMWRDAKKIAHTLPYDFAVLEGTQTGRSLPVERWSALLAPTLVMVGSKSPAFFHHTAATLAAALPAGEYESLAGAHHGSPIMSPDAIAKRVIERFGRAGAVQP